MRDFLHQTTTEARNCDKGDGLDLTIRVTLGVAHQQLCDACHKLNTWDRPGIPDFKDSERVQEVLRMHKCTTRAGALAALKDAIARLSEAIEKFEMEQKKYSRR